MVLLKIGYKIRRNLKLYFVGFFFRTNTFIFLSEMIRKWRNVHRKTERIGFACNNWPLLNEEESIRWK